MAFIHSPKIATDGLVLCLDAGNRRSYPGSGTTWSDVSGNGNTGTLTNGPAFNTTNLGNIAFDGTNDYVSLGTVFNYTTQPFTFSYWVYVNSLTTNQTGQGPKILYKGRYQGNGYYDSINQNGSVLFFTNQAGAHQSSQTTSGIISINTWYNIAYTRNGSSVRIYVNGRDETSSAGTHINPASATTNIFTIALYNNTVDPFLIYSNVTIAMFMGYDKALSAAEVLQNFNATRSRFGV